VHRANGQYAKNGEGVVKQMGFTGGFSSLFSKHGEAKQLKNELSEMTKQGGNLATR
jgi:hypothetical protein